MRRHLRMRSDGLLVVTVKITLMVEILSQKMEASDSYETLLPIYQTAVLLLLTSVCVCTCIVLSCYKMA
jgi:hypothetical protein